MYIALNNLSRSRLPPLSHSPHSRPTRTQILSRFQQRLLFPYQSKLTIKRKTSELIKQSSPPIAQATCLYLRLDIRFVLAYWWNIASRTVLSIRGVPRFENQTSLAASILETFQVKQEDRDGSEYSAKRKTPIDVVMKTDREATSVGRRGSDGQIAKRRHSYLYSTHHMLVLLSIFEPLQLNIRPSSIDFALMRIVETTDA